jgi:hypothetical protein
MCANVVWTDIGTAGIGPSEIQQEEELKIMTALERVLF